MHTLPASLYEKALHFLSTQARPLEAALYRYHFEGGSDEAVYSALAAYQNADGGFGRGLEPDIRLAGSSVIATTVAFQHLRRLGAPADHPLVVSGAGYLVRTFNAERVLWIPAPPEVSDAPHAPWWFFAGVEGFLPDNPRVEIMGYMYDYPDHFPAAIRDALEAALVIRAGELPPEIEMHDLLCYLRLLRTKALPDRMRDGLTPAIDRAVAATVSEDPAEWGGYKLTPLAVVEGPDDLYAEKLAGGIEADLDQRITNAPANGVWSPPWSWGEMHPGAWAEAEREWSGALTLNTLMTLKRFGRL
jgi:hypothetical protein